MDRRHLVSGERDAEKVLGVLDTKPVTIPIGQLNSTLQGQLV